MTPEDAVVFPGPEAQTTPMDRIMSGPGPATGTPATGRTGGEPMTPEDRLKELAEILERGEWKGRGVAQVASDYYEPLLAQLEAERNMWRGECVNLHCLREAGHEGVCREERTTDDPRTLSD